MVERPRVRVDGVVVGPGGPVSGATLNLYPSGVDPSDPANVLFSVATAMSDAGGVFTFLAVPSGDYVLDAVEPSRPVSVSVSADGLPQVVSGPSNGWGKQGLWWRQPLSVGARDIGGLTITLRPGATIRGQVRADPATLAGGPPPGFRVRLGTSSVITADASGRFEITGVPAGRHGFTVSASAVGWRVSQATLNGRDIAGEPLEIDGSDVDGLVVVMSDRLGTVGGTILAGPGQPATDATVALFPADTSAWSYVASDGLRFRSARTLTGQYEFTALPDGDYVLVAIDDAAMAEWPSRDLLQRLSGAGVRVHVAAGQPVTRALTLNPTIR
ncbi:MAG: carboxypeptidase-like regulatory domain-containing protein [Vicinamibacterales bacterium]